MRVTPTPPSNNGVTPRKLFTEPHSPLKNADIYNKVVLKSINGIGIIYAHYLVQSLMPMVVIKVTGRIGGFDWHFTLSIPFL